MRQGPRTYKSKIGQTVFVEASVIQTSRAERTSLPRGFRNAMASWHTACGAAMNCADAPTRHAREPTKGRALALPSTSAVGQKRASFPSRCSDGPLAEVGPARFTEVVVHGFRQVGDAACGEDGLRIKRRQVTGGRPHAKGFQNGERNTSRMTPYGVRYIGCTPGSVQAAAQIRFESKPYRNRS
jgi:hypothetical protein